MVSSKWHLVKDDFIEYRAVMDPSFLTEDMFQASFNDFVIDSGWYGDENGSFITFLIKDADWESPIIKIITKDLLGVTCSIGMCEQYVTLL